MDVVIDGFDVNYDNFHRIMLQYKPSSGSDNDWTTLMSYYNDKTLYDQALANGMNAEMIKAADAGTIKYRWFMDDQQDQRYDLRTVGTSMINNEEVYNYSAVHSGIKDMYNPRLFGSAQVQRGQLGDSVAHTVVHGAARRLSTMQVCHRECREYGSLSRCQSFETIAENSSRIGSKFG